MGFLRKLFCGEKEVSSKRRTIKKVREDAAVLERNHWHNWPERNQEEVSRTEQTTSFEIPVYELEVSYSDGTTEIFRHEQLSCAPDVSTLNEVRRVDLNKTSFRYSETKEDLTTRSTKKETLASFNRDNINSVKILDKTERVVELEYELVETEVTEKMGSIKKREHPTLRPPGVFVDPTTGDWPWSNPQNERELMKKLVHEHSLDYLLDSRTVTKYKAENVEPVQNE
jgi:hypothetical protein